MSIRVAVVDDQALVRGGFAMVLGHQDDIEVVAEAGTGLEAIEAARIHRPDVILMDIRMPEMDGLEATSRIIDAADWPVRVLIVTTFHPDEYVYKALRAGASGFVLKDIPPEELVTAVRTVADGGALPGTLHHQPPHQPVRRAPRPRHQGIVAPRTAHQPRTRGVGNDRARPQQHRDLGDALHRCSNREIACVEHSHQAGSPRPCPGRRVRIRERARRARRPRHRLLKAPN